MPWHDDYISLLSQRKEMENDTKLKTILIEIGELFTKHNLTFSQAKYVLQEATHNVDIAIRKLTKTTLIGNKRMTFTERENIQNQEEA